MKRLIFIYIFSLFFIGIIFSQPNCEEIIAKHLEITGLANIDSEISQYTIQGHYLQNKLKFPFKIMAKSPDKYRMEMIFNNLNFIKVTNGKNNWEYNPMSDTLVTTVEDTPVYQEFIDRWTGGLYHINSGTLKTKYLGIENIEDIEAYKLEITYNNLSRIYYIDKLSYLILRIDDDADGNKRTYYQGYKKIDKYLLPFNMLGYEGGIPAMSMEFSEVKINEPVADSFFNKPETEK